MDRRVFAGKIIGGKNECKGGTHKKNKKRCTPGQNTGSIAVLVGTLLHKMYTSSVTRKVLIPRV